MSEERRYRIVKGDVVAYKGQTWDVKHATYQYIVLFDGERELKLHKKSDLDDVEVIQEAFEEGDS